MDCPKCAKEVLKPGRYCVSCGHDFGSELNDKLSYYFSLREEFEQFGKIQDTLYVGLAKLSKKIQDYEDLLQRDLRNISVSADGNKDVYTPQPSPVFQKPEEVAGDRILPIGTDERTETASEPFREAAHASSDFEVKLGQKWLLIAGILTMVFGVGYFLKYSFEQGWVTPSGRVAMAYVWGIVFLAAGDRFRKKDLAHFGLSLIGGGIAVLYFAAFAAFQIYHLFDQAPSFGIMIMITVLACSLSIMYDTKWLAVLGMVGGFLTPVLLSTGQDNQLALMTYMTILNVGLLAVAFHKKWDILNYLGFIFTYLLYTGWYAQHYTDSKFWPAIIFLNIFYLIYSIAPFAYQFVREDHEELKGVVIMVPNSLIAFAFSYGMIKSHFSLPWVSVITIFYALVFLSMASSLARLGKQQQEAFVILLGKALLFLIITVPIIFSKHWITIFWSAQALALFWMGLKLDRKSLKAGGYWLMGMTVFKFLVYDYGVVFHFSAWNFAVYDSYTNMLPERWLTSMFVLLMLYQMAALAKKESADVLSTERKDFPALFAAWGILLFIVLNIETSAFFHDYLPEARFAAISVLWTIYSVAMIMIGFRLNIFALRKVAFGLFLVTLVKVFLFDISNFSTPYRILSFIVLGLVLVGTSYLYYKYKDSIIDPSAR